MQHLGLTAHDRKIFEATLREPHTRTVKVYVQTLNGDHLAEISNVLIDGQVVVDMDAEITRAATLTFLDPAHALSFDTNSPDDGALYADRMLRIDYVVWVPDLDEHVAVTIFNGPVTGLDRTGETVVVEAQGKEVLLAGAIWRPLTLKKGTRTVDAIRTLLTSRGGETRIVMSTSGHRLPATRTLDRFSSIWKSVKSFAHSINNQVFYAGNGIATLRVWPNTVSYIFNTGDGGEILSPIEVSYALADVKNTIVVVGGTPKGAKSRISVTAIAEPWHPLAPKKIGRDGAPRYLVEKIDNPGLRSKREAREYAKRVLEDRLREVVEVSFDSLPIPHLEPGDLVRAVTDDGAFTFRLRKFTLPLVTTGSPVMPVGYLRRTTVTTKTRRKLR